ncbi:MAG: hypothetical protein ACFCVA_00260 [Gammaproteobacteria bacterium]
MPAGLSCKIGYDVGRVWVRAFVGQAIQLCSMRKKVDMISLNSRICLGGLLLAVAVVADDVTTPSEDESERQTVRVSVQAPNPCWTIKIKSVYSTDQALLVVSQLVPPPGGQNCVQMVGQVEDEVSLMAPPYRVKHLILGRTWDTLRDASGWGPEADYVYLKGGQELSRLLEDARPMAAETTGEDTAKEGSWEPSLETMLSQ